jgi:hypothetical protein
LIEEYEGDGDEYQPAGDCSLPSMPSPAIMSFFHDIVAQQRPTAARLQGEIDHYLSDDLVPFTEKFCVLDWWKVAGTRYPTLRKVAKDIFAIPVTTVASESAFSISGRKVNEHRSHLTSRMLEILMCYQDWLRNKYKGEQMIHVLDIDLLFYYVSSYYCLCAYLLLFSYVPILVLVDAHIGEGSFWTCLQDTQEEAEVSMIVSLSTIFL